MVMSSTLGLMRKENKAICCNNNRNDSRKQMLVLAIGPEYQKSCMCHFLHRLVLMSVEM